ncbi:glycosyltransferase [Streptomyces alboflavus]|uniref:glycosyltransferase n=1 Tax=Streptomyces alboflavus TaxID=67267 RepID=UPI00068FD013|nr:glycosyltransferase [Streptomyces alboflavus]
MDPTPLDGPALRVLLTTWGTMGDVAPYTGLAVGLRNAGHDVTVVTSTRYAPRFSARGLRVRDIPLDHQQELTGRAKPWRERLRNGQDIASTSAQVLLETAAEGTDILLAHPLMHPLCSVIGEGLRVACRGVYTVTHAMMLPGLMVAAPWRGHTLADTTVKLLLNPMYAPAVRELRRELALSEGRVEALSRTLRHHPAWYGISDALLPLRYPLPPGHHTTGYWPPARPPGWKPDSRLRDFLDNGPAPVYFGFGSMHRVDREALGRTITAAAQKLRVRAVVQAGWAELSGHTDDVLTIGECPHDWLFPRMRAAVHHAGPGTVHASLNAAVPTLPVPMGLDQPYWGARLTALGLTPAAIPARRLTADRLTHSLAQLLQRECFRDRTRAVSASMRQQPGIANLLARLSSTGRLHH